MPEAALSPESPPKYKQLHRGQGFWTEMSMPNRVAAQNFAASLGRGDTTGSALPAALTPYPSAGAHQGSAWLRVELTPAEPAQPGEAAKPHSRRASPALVIPPGVGRPGWRPAGHLFRPI